MQFTYEISADEYVASQMLYYKLRFGWRRLQRAAGWILAGILLIVVVGHEKVLNWAPILLAVIGVWWIYAGVMCLFPGYYFRRAYPGSGVSGKQFRVEADEQGFEVFGDVCSWRVRWSGVEIKGEDKNRFHPLFLRHNLHVWEEISD